MGCSSSVIKYLLFIFNFIFVVCGLGLLITGIVQWTKYKNSEEISMIVLGAIIFVIAFFGCCGAIRESPCMLITFAVVLLILFIVQIVIGGLLCAAFSPTSEIYTECKNEVRDDFHVHQNNISSDFHREQLENECCGVDGPKDYHVDLLPDTCCEGKKSPCKIGDKEVFQEGCLYICDIMMLFMRGMGIALVCVALIEFIGAIFAIVLSRSIKNQWRRGAYA